MRRPARERGVTLLELLLALALGALLLTAGLPLLNSVVSAAAMPATTDQPDLDRQAEFAMGRIAMAVRATAPAALDAPAGAPLTSGRWFAPATFQLSGTTLVELRDGDSVPHVLADSVAAFSIVALPLADGRQLVQVDLKLVKGDATRTARNVVRMGWLQ